MKPQISVKIQKSDLTSGTCLAVDLIRAVVLTVVKEVTAQSGANAFAIGTQELILLTCGNSWRGLCRHITTHTSAISLIKVEEEGDFTDI